MTTRSKFRGHDIHIEDETWVFSDTLVPTAECWDRPCGHCGADSTPEGHDGCLGTLPGVMNACCGHGESGDAYVQFVDRSSIRGAEVARWLRAIGTNDLQELFDDFEEQS